MHLSTPEPWNTSNMLEHLATNLQHLKLLLLWGNVGRSQSDMSPTSGL